MKKITFKAMSLGEITLALLLMTSIIALGVPVINTMSIEYKTKIVSVKANNVLEDIVSNLLNNSMYYSSSFANDLDETQYSKFKNAFESYLVSPREMFCPVYLNGEVRSNEIVCFASVDGIVWGIPQTDFEEINVEREEVRNAREVPYVPITVYPNYKYNDALENPVEYFNKNAILYGLRKDGDLIFLNSVIDKEDYPKALHYKAQSYLK